MGMLASDELSTFEIAWSQKSARLEPVAYKVAARVFPFKIRYSDAVHKIGIGGVITRYSQAVPVEFISSCRVVLCHVSNNHLFRLRYHRVLVIDVASFLLCFARD